MGFKGNEPDDHTVMLMEESIAEITSIAEPQSTYERVLLHPMNEKDLVEAGGITFQSKSLYRALRGCDEVILFAATLGRGVDRQLALYTKLNITKAVVFQAVAAAYIEAYCNECQQKLKEELRKENRFLRPRYSPGYGDLSLEVQPDFLQAVHAERKVGIVLSEGGVMVPEKSVTAIMGISTEDSHCVLEGCEVCGKKDCMYRRARV